MLDRTVAPSFKKTTQFDLLKHESVQLKNDVQVHYLSGGKQEVIKIELIFNAGRWNETSPAAAHFSGSLLNKGTNTKSSFQIASVFDLYGAHVEISPGLDLVSVALYSLTKNLGNVLPLFFEILTQSIFPEKELEQSKTIYLQNLKVNQEKTSYQASVNFRRELFGVDHPYGKEFSESEIKNLSRDHLNAHYNKFYRDFFIIVSGKISDASRKLINDTFSNAQFSKVSNRPDATPVHAPKRILTDKEGSVQASVRMGKRFIGRTHANYFGALLLNHILGGYFGSRLMKNIREEKGLTYGVYSSLHTLIHDNYLAIGADVNKENLSLTFDEISKELKRLREEPIAADELETARNHFIGSLQAEITTPFSHADKLKNLIIYSLPADYYTSLIERIDTISASELMEIASVHFMEDSFYEVAVG